MSWLRRSIVVFQLAFTALTGCALNRFEPLSLQQLRGEGYEGTDEIWGRQYRQPDRGVLSSGIDGKAQDIERSLGVE